MEAEQFGTRNTEAGFDAIGLGLVADGDTAVGLQLTYSRIVELSHAEMRYLHSR
jgi:hypothetical protein